MLFLVLVQLQQPLLLSICSAVSVDDNVLSVAFIVLASHAIGSTPAANVSSASLLLLLVACLRYCHRRLHCFAICHLRCQLFLVIINTVYRSDLIGDLPDQNRIILVMGY